MDSAVRRSSSPLSYRASPALLAALLLPERLHAAVGTGWLVALLGAGTVGTAMLLVVNAALLGVRRAELSLLGGVVGSVSRLVAIAALLTLGMVAVGVDASAAHTILTVWVALSHDLRRPVHVVARPCDPGLPVPPPPVLDVPRAALSRLGPRRRARRPGPNLRDTNSRLRHLSARPTRIPGGDSDDRQRFLRGGRRRVQRTAGGLRQRSRTTPSTSAPRFASDRRAFTRPGDDHLPVRQGGAQHLWRPLRRLQSPPHPAVVGHLPGCADQCGGGNSARPAPAAVWSPP